MTNTIASLLTAAHFFALGQIESGNDDNAIGSCREVTRYQIMPGVWRAFTAMNPRNRCDPRAAQEVCRTVWEARITYFLKRYQRRPQNTELYLLWHSPAHVESKDPKWLEAARRFDNLVEKYNHEHP